MIPALEKISPMSHLFILTLYAVFHFYLLGGKWGHQLMKEQVEGPDRLLVVMMLHYVNMGTVNLFLPIGLLTTLLLTMLILFTT